MCVTHVATFTVEPNYTLFSIVYGGALIVRRNTITIKVDHDGESTSHMTRNMFDDFFATVQKNGEDVKLITL